MEIRKATLEDIEQLKALFEYARKFMAQNGNPTQWGTGYPEEKMLKDDINNGYSYVCVENGVIEAAFMFFCGQEETYAKIYDGGWLNDEPYGTIHRLASTGRVKGISKLCMDFCKERTKNLRGDTHADNLPMRRVFEKNGFVQCGKIYYLDNTPRVAYHFVREEN